MGDGPARCECGAALPASRSRWCSSWCESRSARGLPPEQPPPLLPPGATDRPAMVVSLPGGASVSLPGSSRPSMTERVSAAFEAAGMAESWEAGAALDLAASIDGGRGAGSARAALHRELRALMGEALRGVNDPGSRVGSMRDELAARRASRGAS